jgi:hypothetical protein
MKQYTKQIEVVEFYARKAEGYDELARQYVRKSNLGAVDLFLRKARHFEEKARAVAALDQSAFARWCYERHIVPDDWETFVARAKAWGRLHMPKGWALTDWLMSTLGICRGDLWALIDWEKNDWEKVNE